MNTSLLQEWDWRLWRVYRLERFVIGAQREPKDPALETFRENMRKRYGEWLAREQGLINREHLVDPDAIHKARPKLGVEVVKTIKK